MPSHSRLESLRHAARGLRLLVASQPNARIHLAAASGVTALGLLLHIDAGQWALLVLAISGVLCAEALNTALELMVDLASPEWHALARDVKDVAAAAVLLASAGAVGVGLFVLGPGLLQLLSPLAARLMAHLLG